MMRNLFGADYYSLPEQSMDASVSKFDILYLFSTSSCRALGSTCSRVQEG
jgi:hypothetical protein